MGKALAITYRPNTWEDVVEQDVIKSILQNQLNTNSFKHAYLFTGPAGCGKTTCARIFALDINSGRGNPIELDAASNNSVEDVRELIQQAKTRSIDSEYKVFILDECHALSNSAWQAMLKILEEPPAKTIFIFCTTDPQKIPATIISRVQRYDFRRISQHGIINRLVAILAKENMLGAGITMQEEALEYVARLADGGMRDAITLLDKCLSYSSQLTVDNVVAVLGVASYSTMFDLTYAVLDKKGAVIIDMVEQLYDEGKDIKQFVKQYALFLLDVIKYFQVGKWEYVNIPPTDQNKKRIEFLERNAVDECYSLLSTCINLSVDIKYSSTPKQDLEVALLLML